MYKRIENVKIIKLLIITLILITLTGCQLSKEEVIKKSQFTTINSIAQKTNNNIINAKKEFIGNYYSIIGYVKEINDNRIQLYDPSSHYGENRGLLNASMPTEEIQTLEKEQRVEIVGEINKIDTEVQSSTANGTTFNYNTTIIYMKNSYIKNDEFEVFGKVKIPTPYTTVLYGSKSTTKKSTWYCHIDTYDVSTFGEEKEFTSSDNKTSKVAGQYIKNDDYVYFVGKIFYQNNSSTNTTGYVKDMKITKINDEIIKQ